MKLKWTVASALVLSVCTWMVVAHKESHAQDEAQERPAAPESVIDKVSYGIGLNIGRSLQQEDFDLNAELLVRGIRDALAENDPALTEEEIRDAMVAFQQELQAKQLEMRKQQAEANKQEGEEYLAKNKQREGVTTLKTGLQYEVIKSGDGDSPKETDTVRTHYRGTLIDGTEFDSSYKRGEPAVFPVNGVIKGWIQALQLMKVGDKWRLFVPAELAYGERGSGGVIGPNQVLIFEVELLAIEEDE